MKWLKLRRQPVPNYVAMEAVEAIKLLQFPQLHEEFALHSDQVSLLTSLPSLLKSASDPLQLAAQTWRKWVNSHLLTTPQLQRLQQMVWQRRGEAALANPDFRARLHLTPRQGAAIESTLEAVRAEIDAIPQGSDRSLIKQKVGEKLTAILSSDQIRIWNYLVAADSPPR